MHALRARVENGRLKLDEPTDLPEGTVLELVPANDSDEVFSRDDELADEQRAYVHGRIVESIRGRRAGAATFDADEVMAELAPKP